MNLNEVLFASKMSGKSTGNADLSDYYTKQQTESLLDNKVDKVTSKGLSTNDFTNAYKNKLDSLQNYDDTQIKSDISANTTAINNKVDKVTGKGLSTNDFTNAYKNKLDSLQNYDDTQVKSDISGISKQMALNLSTLGYQRKNLLLNNCSNTTQNGVTATVNADGSITFSGNNTSNKDFVIYWNLQTGNTDQLKDNKKFLPDGMYILSGGNNGIYLQIITSTDNITVEKIFLNKNGVETKFTINPSDKYVWGRVLVASTADFSSEPVTIYPMVRLSEITDDTYEPYKPSIEERLTALENAIAGGINL